MEEFYYEYTPNYDYNDDYNTTSPVFVMECMIISLGLPLTLAAIYSLYTQVRSDHVAPIYVINLLLSDLLQFCYMIALLVQCRQCEAELLIYAYSLLVSVGFMVCVAMERYLVIVHPLWYRCRRTIKSTVVVCVVVWLLPLGFILPIYFFTRDNAANIVFGVSLLLPLPLLIFFLGATVTALPASISVPLDEKRRTVGVLVLVLLIYTVLFLPAVITYYTIFIFHISFLLDEFMFVSHIFLELSPLADLVLYVFMRKGAVDKLLAAVCCCITDSSDISSSV